MKTSEPITLFQQFVEVLVAVLAHPATPAAAREHFQSAAVAFVSESCGFAPDAAALRPALLKAFAAHLAGTANPPAHGGEGETDTRVFRALGLACQEVSQ